MQQYQLSPHVFFELFTDDAVLLVADRNIMVTINHAAARKYELASATADDKTFTRSDLLNFLLDNYEVSKTEAELQLRSLLCFGLRHGVVYKNIHREAVDSHRQTASGKAIYKRRKETIERSFADAK